LSGSGKGSAGDGSGDGLALGVGLGVAVASGEGELERWDLAAASDETATTSVAAIARVRTERSTRFHNWKTLPCEPYPTWPDYSPRMGTALTDGSILTWSSVDYTDEPEFGGSGALRVAKRLHLSWWE
jgi:hypothetical protein